MHDSVAAGRPSSREAHSRAGREQAYLRNLLQALLALRSGDFSVRMPSDHLGLQGKIADAFNEIAACNARMAQELEQVGQVVG